MKNLVLAAIVAGGLATAVRAQTTRMASDFEIEQTERQLAGSRDFLTQLSGHLNLGDLRLTRNESSRARAEYERALDIATRERLESRRASNLTRYANATAYAGLAEAKLGKPREAFEFMEEAVRYASDDGRIWNIYSTAMSQLRLPAKAASVARNAVSLAARALDQEPSIANRLDLAVYQHSLASALLESGQPAEAERLLVEITTALRSPAFAPLQRDVARKESFEIYSSARGDEAAYLSLLNRAQLRLAALYEARGDTHAARTQYEHVLEARTDDANALAGLARLADGGEVRDRYFDEAFDANPFSLELVRDYQRYLAQRTPDRESQPSGAGTGSRVRLALHQLARGDRRAARTTLDALIAKFPDNDTLRLLRREAERSMDDVPAFLIDKGPGSRPGEFVTPSPAQLHQLLELLAGERLTAEQRTKLDELTFRSLATYDITSTTSTTADTTTFESGSIESVPFRFSEPTAFRGSFPKPALRLTYRILGATQQDGRDALLLEPLGLEPAP